MHGLKIPLNSCYRKATISSKQIQQHSKLCHLLLLDWTQPKSWGHRSWCHRGRRPDYPNHPIGYHQLQSTHLGRLNKAWTSWWQRHHLHLHLPDSLLTSSEHQWKIHCCRTAFLPMNPIQTRRWWSNGHSRFRAVLRSRGRSSWVRCHLRHPGCLQSSAERQRHTHCCCSAASCPSYPRKSLRKARWCIGQWRLRPSSEKYWSLFFIFWYIKTPKLMPSELGV